MGHPVRLDDLCKWLPVFNGGSTHKYYLSRLPYGHTKPDTVPILYLILYFVLGAVLIG
jgi:hypothetical protein